MHPLNHPVRILQLYRTVWHTLIKNPKFYIDYRSLNEKNILGLVISVFIAGGKIIFSFLGATVKLVSPADFRKPTYYR
jgi:hypothetical protein